MKRIAVLFVLGLVVYLHRLEPFHWSALAIQIFHSLHGPGFALLAVGVYFAMPSRFAGTRRLLLAGAVTMAIGVITELIQIPGGRAAQLADIRMNAIGVIAGLSLVALFSSSIRKNLSATGLALVCVVGIAASVIAFAATLRATHAYAMQRMASPTLLSFEHEWEHRYFGQNEHVDPQLVDAPPDWPAAGKTIATADENGNHGALLFIRPVANWTDYSSLSFIAASANKKTHTVMISIRQMRDKGKRQPAPFKIELQVSAEPRRYTIDFSDILSTAGHEQFDFRLIESIIVSAAHPGSDVSVLLDDFRLHPKTN